MGLINTDQLGMTMIEMGIDEYNGVGMVCSKKCSIDNDNGNKYLARVNR
jgi:hypothetical protein